MNRAEFQALLRQERGQDDETLRRDRSLLQRLLAEAAGAGETALTIGTGMAGEVAGGYAGAYDMAFGQGDARGARDAVQDAMTYMPRTPEGQRNLRAIGEGMEAIADTPLAPGGDDEYQPATIGDVGRGIAEGWDESIVPWMQQTFGDEAGSGILGVLGAGAAPARPAGRVRQLAEQLESGAIEAGKFRKELLKRGYITEEEASKMPRGREKTIAKTLLSSPGMNPQDLAAAALAGWPKIGWYRNSAKALQDIFGDDAPRFAYLLSALSPQTSVESNLKNTVNTWSNWVKAGRPSDKDEILQIMARSVEGEGTEKSVLDAWRNNAFRALSTDDIHDIRFSGPKVSSFARNLLGQLGEVTNDTWMARAMNVEQDIFGGAKNSKVPADEFGEVYDQSAGYTAANAITREAAQIVSRKLKDHGVEVTPAEIQETVWSYSMAAQNLRNAPGETRTVSQLWDEGMITPEVIDSVPDFGTLLHTTPEYHRSLSEAGARVDNIQPPVKTTFTPDVPLRQLAQFNERLEANYRRSRSPEFLRRQNASTLRGSPLVVDEGRLVSPRWMQGAKGRELRIDPERARMFESMGLAPPKLYALEPGTASGSLFSMLMSEGKRANPYGAAVDVYDPEKYANMRLLMGDEGRMGMAVDDGNITSVVRAPGSREGNFADRALPVAIDQGGRRLDAFDTVLPPLYSRQGFKPVNRVPFDDEYAPEGWDYERFGQYNEGRPDVMTMALDPENAKVLPKLQGRYDKQSGKQKNARDAILEGDYMRAMELLMEEEQAIRQSGRYKAY